MDIAKVTLKALTSFVGIVIVGCEKALHGTILLFLAFFSNWNLNICILSHVFWSTLNCHLPKKMFATLVTLL